MRERFRRPLARLGWTVLLAVGVYHAGLAVFVGTILFQEGFVGPAFDRHSLAEGGTAWLLLVGASLASTLLAGLTARRARRIGASWLLGAAAVGALGTYRLEPDPRALAHGLLLWYGPQLAIGVALLAGRRAP